MPFLKKITILLVFVMLLSLRIDAEDIWRLRYSVPISSEVEIDRRSDKKKAKFLITGHSGSLLFANGVGLGYSTFLTKGETEESDYKFKNHNLDLSYTIGDELSFTIGIGSLIYGKGELTYNGVTFITENSSGQDFFVDFGIPFIVGEFIFGYRKNYAVYDNYQSQHLGQTMILDDSLKLYSSLIKLGFGFLF